MATRKIELTDHFNQYIDTKVASGQYSDASEIVGAALRLLECADDEREAKLKLLRRAAREGFDAIDRGEGILLRGPEAIGNFLDEIVAEVRNERKQKGRQRA